MQIHTRLRAMRVCGSEWLWIYEYMGCDIWIEYQIEVGPTETFLLSSSGPKMKTMTTGHGRRGYSTMVCAYVRWWYGVVYALDTRRVIERCTLLVYILSIFSNTQAQKKNASQFHIIKVINRGNVFFNFFFYVIWIWCDTRKSNLIGICEIVRID